MNASQKQPPVLLRGTMQVHAWYSEVIVELYCKAFITDKLHRNPYKVYYTLF